MLKNLFLGTMLTFAAATLSAQKSPAGYVIFEDSPGGGSSATYFYKNGNVIATEDGCEEFSAAIGTWSLSGKTIKILISKLYYYECDGERIADGSNCTPICTSHKAAVKTINLALEEDWYDGIVADNSDEEANISIGKMEASENVHSFLRTSFVGKYDASARLLTESELKNYSAYELKIMRNEIFARYGFKFTTKEMKDYFGKQSGYEAKLNDVSPFLSDIETKNIATIKKVEATKK
jgi:hypothetical protein